MPNTARTHFDEDIGRVEALLAHARQLENNGDPERVWQDIRLSAVAMSIGAMDAYLCDKYVDCLSSVLRAYSQDKWVGTLPKDYRNERLPAGFVLDTSRSKRPGWNIRMAARSIMEKENVLSLSRVDEMFNPILPSGKKLWADFIPTIIDLGRKRLSGPRTNAEIAALTGKQKEKATRKAISTMKGRISEIAQIRHDWIHNCSRPKSAIGKLGHQAAELRIRDVKDVVTALDDHIETNRKA